MIVKSQEGMEPHAFLHEGLDLHIWRQGEGAYYIVGVTGTVEGSRSRTVLAGYRGEGSARAALDGYHEALSRRDFSYRFPKDR